MADPSPPDFRSADVNYAETLSTLQFAQRAKRVQCKAVRQRCRPASKIVTLCLQIINEAESGETAALQAEIIRLKEQLQAAASSTRVNSGQSSAQLMAPSAATLLRIHARAALTSGPSSPAPNSFSDDNFTSDAEDAGAAMEVISDGSNHYVIFLIHS
jgi:hypothetical protein